MSSSGTTYAEPVAPAVLIIGDQATPWVIAPITRAEVIYQTPTTVRVQYPSGPKKSHQQSVVFSLYEDGSWGEAQHLHACLQADLDRLAARLTQHHRRYAECLAAWGKSWQSAPNPLCPSVIDAPDPAAEGRPGFSISPLQLPRIQRFGLERHSQKMLFYRDGYDPVTQDRAQQQNHFCCERDEDWELTVRIVDDLRATRRAWDELLARLGTYADAVASDRRAAIHRPAA